MMYDIFLTIRKSYGTWNCVDKDVLHHHIPSIFRYIKMSESLFLITSIVIINIFTITFLIILILIFRVIWILWHKVGPASYIYTILLDFDISLCAPFLLLESLEDIYHMDMLEKLFINITLLSKASKLPWIWN